MERQSLRSTIFHTLFNNARLSEDNLTEVTFDDLPKLEAFEYFKQLQDLAQEVSVMKQLKHKHIAQFKGVILDPCPCLVMEFAPGGDLACLIERRRDQLAPIDDLLNRGHVFDVAHDGILGRELTHRLAFQIALGIEYLHSKSICHLDLKPSNVLVWSGSLTDPVNVKITDYGISCTVTSAGVNSLCGSLGYQAPEQIASRKNRGESFDLRVDIFAYGVTLYVMLTGIHPFEKEMKEPFMYVIEEKIRRSKYPSLPTGQSLVYLQFLIDRCWRYWPSERPSASQIVAEMCEPSFHVQCEDLLVSGTYRVLATTLANNSTLFPHPDNTHACFPQMLSLCKLPRPSDTRPRMSSTSSLPGNSLSSACLPAALETEVLPAGPQTSSFESEMLSLFDDKAKTSFNPQSPNFTFSVQDNDRDLHIEGTQTGVQGSDINVAKAESDRWESKSNHEREIDTETPSIALVATSDSLLVASPQSSRFLFAQKLKIQYGDISALMFLNDRLWIGLRPQVRSSHGSSGQLQVFECYAGEIGRRVQLQTFSCNDVIEDIQYQLSSDRMHATVFGLLGNGELMVVRGQVPSTTERQLNCWGEDSIYRWNYPELRKIGKIGLEKEEAAEVGSCFVVTQAPLLWYCQGNSITTLAAERPTERDPLKVISVDRLSKDFATIPGFRIKHAALLGDTVWFSSCEETTCNTLFAVDVARRTLIGHWTLQEIVRLFDGSKQPLKEHDITTRVCPSKRLVFVPPRSVQCLAAVCDTLWVACDNGAILVVRQDSRDTPLSLLATLWCRPVLSHVLVKKRAALPSVIIREMTQVGDRVVVYRGPHPIGDRNAEQTIVAEVFQALSSSQLRKLTAYYDVWKA